MTAIDDTLARVHVRALLQGDMTTATGTGTTTVTETTEGDLPLVATMIAVTIGKSVMHVRGGT